jgi:hypothetical protein
MSKNQGKPGSSAFVFVSSKQFMHATLGQAAL